MEPRFLIPVIVAAFLIVMGFSITGFLVCNTPPQRDFACEGCNVLIFTIDTLRADHLSSYGYFQETTPNIDSLAREGTTFVNAFSQIPHTPPSHWSIFTGLYPYKHGKFTPSGNGSGLITLPDILGENGYVTGGFVSSKMLRGFSNEFDYFNGEKERRVYRGPVMKRANETTGLVLSWLEEHATERFFLWVHYFDPHSPYNPPKDFDIYNYSKDPHYSDPRYGQTGFSRKGTIRDDIAKYDGEVRYTDENVGVVIGKLRDLGLEGRTLIILLSDHGECFGEHNFSDFGYEDRRRPCLFHGKTLYDEEVHIPLIIVNPKSPTKRVKIEDVVETVDLLPTVLDILGLKNTLETDGESLVSSMENGERTKDYALLHTRPKRSGALAMGIRTGKWKLVNMIPSDLDLEKEAAEQEGGNVNFTEEVGTEFEVKKFLFRVDEGEKKNFYDSEAKVAENLEKRLKNVIPAGGFSETIEIDRQTEEILRTFGYIQ